MLLGVALWQALAARHSSVAPAARFHATSQLRTRASAQKKKGLSTLPVAAQGPISAALGAENPAYRVSASGGALRAATPAQHFSTSFDRSGLTLTSGAAHVGLSVRAMGYGASLSALGQVAPTVRANRVFYERRDLSEWYANGPLGLEQGFTIPRAPAGHAAGALTLSMALSGNAYAALGGGGKSITLSRAGRPALRYSRVTATDARGRVLHSWLQLEKGQILVRVDAAGARYPLRIDPFVQQGEKLTGSGEKGEEGAFGYSVAVSSNGEYALVGGPSDNGKAGAAWVFLRSGTTWTQQGPKLTGKEEAGAGEFGTSVSLSEKGEYALIGGAGDNEKTGAAWVFLRTGTTWAQQAKLTAKVGEETGAGEFGKSVSISATGEYALIGEPGDNAGVGGAWVFFRESGKTTWAQQGAKLVAKSGEETGAGGFGYSVSIAATKGEYALVGAPADKEGAGAAWVFLRTGTTWAQQGAKLVAKSGEETATGEFGKSVAIAGAGENAVMGAPGDKEGLGGAFAFLRTGTSWAQQGAKLVAKSGEETATGEFGASVAISATKGEYALIGAPGDKENVGTAFVFLRTGTTWAQQGAKLTGSGESGLGVFGDSVALSGEGNYALVGGALDREAIGAAWVFFRETGKTTWAQQGEKLTGKEEVHEGETAGKGELGYSAAVSATGEYALIGGPGDSKQVGAAWVFLRSGTTWTQQAKLTGKEEVGAAEFGRSVSISEKGEYALIGGSSDKEGIGAAWVFLRTGTTWAQQGVKLTAKAGEETGPGEFGKSVSISATGEYALIGAPADKEGLGAAWVFFRESGKTEWKQQGAKLVAKSGEETTTGEFGYSVSIAATKGEYALIGAPGDKENIGTAFVFLRSGTTWTQQGAKLVAKTGEETGAGSFGKSVSISGAGEYALMGAPDDKEKIGAAFVFLRSGTTWTQQGGKLAAKSGEETGAGEFGYSVSVAPAKGEYALMGAPSDNLSIGAAWVFLRTGTTWAQQGGEANGQRGEQPRPVRPERVAVGRRQLRADGRPEGQQRNRRGVGLLPRNGQNDLGPAGRKAHR